VSRSELIRASISLFNARVVSALVFIETFVQVGEGGHSLLRRVMISSRRERPAGGRGFYDGFSEPQTASE
jgi:hypothetical protein